MTQASLERDDTASGNADGTPPSGRRFTPKASFVADIMAGREIEVRSPEGVAGRKKFEVLYAEVGTQDTGNFSRKLALATTLLDQPNFTSRFPRPNFLLRDFVPGGVAVTSEIQGMRDDLRKKMIEVGVIDPKGADASKFIDATLGDNPDYQDLINAGWSVEVVGQLMALDLFSNVSDMRKKEELWAWTTRALLRPYLGVITGVRPEQELSMEDTVNRLPRRVFEDASRVRNNIVLNYLEQRLARMITDAGLQEGLNELEGLVAKEGDNEKRIFLEQVLTRFEGIATEPLNPNDVFKEQIVVKGKKHAFPSFEQRTFASGFKNEGTRFLTADTGLGKTGAAYLAMENSAATRVLVFAVAFGRETWATEEAVVFKEPGKVFTIESMRDLDSDEFLNGNHKYIVVSQDLISRAETTPGLARKLEEVFIDKLGINGSIIDEIDNLSNSDTVTTRNISKLLAGIRANYQASGHADGAPVIGMTATAIRTGLHDLSAPMAMLYPDDYAMPGEATSDKHTFSDKCLGRPDLVYLTLTGERRMYRWESATGVQEFKYESVSLEPSPFEKYLYDFIMQEAEGDALSKIRLLEDMLLNPLLVKAEVRQRAWKALPELDLDEAMEELKLVVNRWKTMRGVDSPQSAEDFLSADVLVRLGKGDLVLAAFLDSLLEDGIETLIEEMTRGSADPDLMLLREFWQRRELSTKYEILQEKMADALEWKENPDGTLSRSKVMIVSPSRKQGRTGDVLQRDVSMGDGLTTTLYASYELDLINDTKLATLVGQWFPDESVMLIDGDVSIGRRRNTVINRWTDKPDDAILLATLESIYQSRDFTLNEVVDSEGRRISSIYLVYLDFSWYYQKMKQTAGRHLRQGMLLPVKADVLEAVGTVNSGKRDAVRLTELLSRMALSGIALTAEEQEFLDSKKIGNRIPMLSPEARFRISILSKTRGAGEDLNLEFLESEDNEGNVVGEKFAEIFYDEGKDEFKTTGYNAEMVAEMAEDLGVADGQILSVGAGTLLLQRKLKRGIDNVDINGAMMEKGWSQAAVYGGNKIIGRASRLGEVVELGKYDFVDLAFVLHWTKLNGKVADSERVKVIENINLALKDGGYAAITLPEHSMDDGIFAAYVQTLEKHFGFEVVGVKCGMSFGVSKLGFKKRLGWSIVVRKKGPVDTTGMDLKSLELNYDKREWVNDYKEKEKRFSGREYPDAGVQLNFDEFEIINPLMGDEQIAIPVVDEVLLEGNFGLGDPEVSTGSALVDQIIAGDVLEGIQGSTPIQYAIYRKGLVKRLMSSTGWSWARTENFIRGITGKLSNENKTRSRFRLFGLIIREAKKEQGKDVN